MLEFIAKQSSEIMDELLKELLASDGIQIDESDMRNIEVFKQRLEKDGYSLTTWNEGDQSFYKLSRFGKDIMGLQTWTKIDYGSEKLSAKFMHKWSPLR